MLESLRRVYAALPAEQEYLVEYKLFEPAFYATDLADWGSALLVCQSLGERARVLVDMGHHAQGVNVEQIVSILAAEERLGGFHFNNRKYADDDLIVGSVNPFELFLVFCELAGSGRPLPRLTIDQSHNIEAKVEAMVMSVVNIQDAYARALIVDRERARDRAAERRCARRPPGPARRLQHRRAAAVRERARARSELPRTPWRALRASGRFERIAAERADAGGRAMSATDRADRDAPRISGRATAPCRATCSTSSCAPRTCSAPTARSRTSAAATPRPRARRSTTRASSAR